MTSKKKTIKSEADEGLDRKDAWRTALVGAIEPKKALSEYTPHEILDIFRKADSDNPTPEAVTELRTLLRQHPELWKVSGDMAALAVKNLIDSVNATRSTRESIEAAMEAIRTDLGYEHASTLEKLLIEHVAVCWLRMYLMDFHFTNSTKGSIMLTLGSYLERRLTITQKRYLLAIETLARVRRLMRPVPLQVNIAGAGGQQINTVHATEAGEAGKS